MHIISHISFGSTKFGPSPAGTPCKSSSLSNIFNKFVLKPLLYTCYDFREYVVIFQCLHFANNLAFINSDRPHTYWGQRGWPIQDEIDAGLGPKKIIYIHWIILWRRRNCYAYLDLDSGTWPVHHQALMNRGFCPAQWSKYFWCVL